MHGEDLGDGEIGLEAAALQHDPDSPSELDVARRGIHAEHRHGASVARAVTLEDLDRGRLAGAIGAEHREDLAFLDGEVDVLHRNDIAVDLAEALDLNHSCHGCELRTPCRSRSAAARRVTPDTRPDDFHGPPSS